MFIGRVIALAFVGITAQVPGCRQPLECIDFESRPIAAGQSYSHPIQHELVFRFTAETGRGSASDQQVWHITVGPEGPTDRIDYVWPVSFPINSTHHLFVGPALDWTAAESMSVNPRRLNFVLTSQALAEAETLHARATKQVVDGSAFAPDGLRRLGKGELTVSLEGVVKAGTIESIRLFVRSCVPAGA